MYVQKHEICVKICLNKSAYLCVHQIKSESETGLLPVVGFHTQENCFGVFFTDRKPKHRIEKNTIRIF